MSAAQVLMYVTGWCPYCGRARSLLEGKGVAVEEIDVEAVPGARAQMMARCGQNTVPQIFIGTEHVELDATGRLDSLLKTTGAC